MAILESLRLEPIGPPPSAMQHREDHDLRLNNGVSDDVRRARDNELTGTVDTARPSEVGMVDQPAHRSEDRGVDPRRRGRVAFGDVASRRLKVVKRPGAPDDVHSLTLARRRARQFALAIPGPDPADDILVQDARRTGTRLVERRLDVLYLPCIDIDKGSDRLA